MSYVLYAKLTPEQSAVVVALHPDWDSTNFQRFEFWVNKNGQASRKKGHHQITEATHDVLINNVGKGTSALVGPTITKDMPKKWTGSPPMHLGSNKD